MSDFFSIFSPGMRYWNEKRAADKTLYLDSHQAGSLGHKQHDLTSGHLDLIVPASRIKPGSQQHHRAAINPPTNQQKLVTVQMNESRVVSASREVFAPADKIFELIADPHRQPEWDGNDNLDHADEGQRVHAVGDVFLMNNTNGTVRANHVIEFEEGRHIAWQPSEIDQPAPGQIWGWRLKPLDDSRTEVTHYYDWTKLTDEQRLPRAQATTSDKLMASIERLAELAEK